MILQILPLALDAMPEFERLSKDEKCANPNLKKIKDLILFNFGQIP